MAAKVFISYRRDDSAGHAGRVYERLEREFGREVLFMDDDAIVAGVDFVKVIEEEVAKSDVLLAIIGRGWLGARDETPAWRRAPNDFARIEIAAALRRGIPVIPILVDGTSLPDRHLLPDDIKGLVKRQAEFVESRTFDADVERLIRKLRERLRQLAPEAEERRAPASRGALSGIPLSIPAEWGMRSEEASAPFTLSTPTPIWLRAADTIALTRTVGIAGFAISASGLIVGFLWPGPITGLFLPFGLALLWQAQRMNARSNS